MQDTFLRFHILFTDSCWKPDFDALADMLNGISKEDLGMKSNIVVPSLRT
jgi:hypothetical protein